MRLARRAAGPAVVALAALPAVVLAVQLYLV